MKIMIVFHPGEDEIIEILQQVPPKPSSDTKKARFAIQQPLAVVWDGNTDTNERERERERDERERESGTLGCTTDGTIRIDHLWRHSATDDSNWKRLRLRLTDNGEWDLTKEMLS